MPFQQAKPLHVSPLQQELLQRMGEPHDECPTTRQARSHHSFGCLQDDVTSMKTWAAFLSEQQGTCRVGSTSTNNNQ